VKNKKRKGRPKKLKRLSPEQLEQALQHVLTSTLAIYVLNRSTRPISKVVRELTDIQFNAAQLIGFILNLQSKGMSRPEMNNALAGVFSFIPFRGARKPKFNDRESPDG
jgi:hypothetical protein